MKKNYPEPTSKTRPGGGGEWSTYNTNEWHAEETGEKWERENTSTRNYRSEEARETETERSDRRSRHIRGNLIEAEKERTVE